MREIYQNTVFPDRIFPYKDRIADSVFMQEITSQRKPVFWYFLCNEKHRQKLFWKI